MRYVSRLLVMVVLIGACSSSESATPPETVATTLDCWVEATQTQIDILDAFFDQMDAGFLGALEDFSPYAELGPAMSKCKQDDPKGPAISKTVLFLAQEATDRTPKKTVDFIRALLEEVCQREGTEDWTLTPQARDACITMELQSSDQTQPTISVLLTAPSGTDPEVVDVAAAVIRSRLAERLSSPSDTGYVEASRIGIDQLLVSVRVDSGLTTAELIDVVSVRGEVSFRPVIDVVEQSPALTDPDGDHPENLDPVTGLSDPDDVNAEVAYLAAGDGFVVYVVGPAFMTSVDMEGGVAGTSGAAAEIVVVPEFTREGGEKFRNATGELATYPVGSPQRQLAIVVDGVVTTAPAVAAGVDPAEGLDPNQVVITIGASENPQAEAENLATLLDYGALPVVFEIEVTDPTG